MFEYGKNIFKDEIERIEKELKQMPKGFLVRKGTTYYHRKEGVDYGISRNPDTIRILARKRYLQECLKRANINYLLVQRFLQKYKSSMLSDLMPALPGAFQQLPLDYFFLPDETQAPATNPYFQDELTIRTDKGLAVRSKSELIIANVLDMRQIPYQYEAALELSGKIKYPDFTMRRLSDGALIVWEHFGLLSDAGYRQQVKRKIALYAENGYFPYENLICSYEKDVRDSRRIHDLIDRLILR